MASPVPFPARSLSAQTQSALSRRQFLSGCIGLAALAQGCSLIDTRSNRDQVIDIHQHVNYSGRPDNVLLQHQNAMGITLTILLPAGRPVNSLSTHGGSSNGLQAKCAGNEACWRLAKAHPKNYRFGANEVPDMSDATSEIEKYLKLGAVVIGEQKFGIECDAPEMQRIYALAADYRVPVLMHWQYKMYNYGFERFYKMLERFPHTTFIGHAQTWWANIDQAYKDDDRNLYPKGKVTPGGTTDRYLNDYPNMYGDLSAGSGLNALKRDEDQAREFIQRHQDKLIYGSDCNDLAGTGPACQGAQTITEIRRLSPNPKIERKLLWQNAKRLFRL